MSEIGIKMIEQAKSDQHGIKVTPPQIPETTLAEMTNFFLKTSIPRILKEREENERERTNCNTLHIQQ